MISLLYLQPLIPPTDAPRYLLICNYISSLKTFPFLAGFGMDLKTNAFQTLLVDLYPLLIPPLGRH